jgi:hypothetical protein
MLFPGEKDLGEMEELLQAIDEERAGAGTTVVP